MRFDDRVTGRLDKYAKQAKVIHLDIDPAEIDKNVKAEVGVWGDCKETLPLLTNLVNENKHEDWLAKFRDYNQQEIDQVITPELYPTSDEMTMGEVLRNINEICGGDAVIVTDVGQHQMVACRYAKFNNTRSNITSGGLGTMGFGLPAAIGAKYGAPDKTVIAIIGDGGFQMTPQELGTIMQFGAAVKILILNNRFLGMVRQWQQLFHDKRYSFVNITSPDFVALAKSYYIEASKVDERANLRQALETMINHDGSYLLEVMVGRENNVFPMVPQGMSVSEIRLK
jgi:acetolactate synthase-1/2/3 large subunit